MFEDRKEAGEKLASRLKELINDNTIILAVPRGGVNIGYEIAKRYNAPLDVIIVKKIGHPRNPEYAIGAVSMDDSFIYPDHVNIPRDYIRSEVTEKQRESRERYRELRGEEPPLDLTCKQVILVDDGVATGATMKMAIRVVRKKNPYRIIVAIPVAPPASAASLKEEADEVITLMEPVGFMAIGQFYKDFSQVPTEEAKRYLERAK